MTETHTPGPWAASEVGLSRGHVFAVGLDGHQFVVANCKASSTFVTASNRETDLANARLVASAPDGLSVAREALDFIASAFGPADGDTTSLSRWSDGDACMVCQQLENFIVKATGEQNEIARGRETLETGVRP